MLQIFTTYLEKNGTLKIADTVNKVENIKSLKKFVVSSFPASLFPVVQLLLKPKYQPAKIVRYTNCIPLETG